MLKTAAFCVSLALAHILLGVPVAIGGLGAAQGPSSTLFHAPYASSVTMTTDEGSSAAPGYEALTARRLDACSALLTAVTRWLGPVVPSPQNPWLVQRQAELILRAIQSMQGSVLLARRGLWSPTYALARMLIEDAAVAHWLAVHPDPDALEARWRKHLLATHLSDIQTQEELDLGLDPETVRWQREQDPGELASIEDPRKLARAHWTGRSPVKLASDAADRPAPSRTNWNARSRELWGATARFAPLANRTVKCSATRSASTVAARWQNTHVWESRAAMPWWSSSTGRRRL